MADGSVDVRADEGGANESNGTGMTCLLVVRTEGESVLDGVFAGILEERGWRADAAVRLAFTREFPAGQGDEDIAEAVQQDVQDAAFESDLNETPCVFLISDAPPQTFVAPGVTSEDVN